MVNVTEFTGGGKMPPQAEQPPAQPGVGAETEHTPENPNSSLQTPAVPFFMREGHPPPSHYEPDTDPFSDNTVRAMEAVRDRSKFELEKEKVKASRQGGPGFLNPAKPEDIILEVAMSGDQTTKLEYLIDPWLPRRQVVGFYGRGGTAKSSFVATMAARGSEEFSTLWISTEELREWVRVRHIKMGGCDGTLFVAQATITRTDTTGRAAASTFNVYEHLEAAIVKAQQTVMPLYVPTRPLRLVVLDTAVALTTWTASESPNSDAGVKRLMAYLQSLCEKFDVTIAVIGHSNKGKHEELSDSVAGSGAWVNSPRQAFIHIRDKCAENCFVVCAVKHSLTPFYVASYYTHFVHTLAERDDGNNTVLCATDVQPIEWDYYSAMDMISAARGDAEQDENNRTSNKQSSVDLIVTTVLNQLVTGVSTDRQSVHAALGHEPSRRHWQDADDVLTTQHKVTIRLQGHGRKAYERA